MNPPGGSEIADAFWGSKRGRRFLLGEAAAEKCRVPLDIPPEGAMGFMRGAFASLKPLLIR